MHAPAGGGTALATASQSAFGDGSTIPNVGESMKYYVQYKRSAEQFYRTYGSLNSAREVMDVLRTGRQRDSNLHYIWARYESPPDMPAK
jgi:hypothetical protein